LENELNKDSTEVLEVNKKLQKEVDELTRELRKTNRELRAASGFLDKVTRAAEAKDTLNAALSSANLMQKSYTDMLLLSCPSIIVLFDTEGRLVLSTNALLAAMGIPNFDYIRNKRYDEIFAKYISKNDIKTVKAAIKELESSDNRVHFEVLIDFEKSGVPRYYSVELSRVNSVRDGGGMSETLAVLVDLTDIMHEKKLAEDANKAKSEFLAKMSHEIRTPMNAIMGMSEMLNRSDMDESQKKYLSDIRKSSTSLLTIINDILDFSKIEAGKLDIVESNYSLIGLLHNLQSLFEPLSDEKNLDLHFEIDKDLPKTVMGDEIRLRQILTNLLSNAVKYTSEGEVTLTAKLNGSFITFIVKDTGLGILDKDKDRLFRPFEQLDPQRNKNVVGSGLGLPITYNLCTLMGGTLWYESIYEKGSTFYVSIPYQAADAEVIEEVDEHKEFTAKEAKVLIVDDIDINLSVAKALLSAFEITPDLVLSGKEAIKSASEIKYDIIFMDHMMPNMDGLEATKRIRNLGGWNEKVPIIAFTANAIVGVKKMFLENKLDDFLSKPIETRSLNQCLRKWLPHDMIKEESND